MNQQGTRIRKEAELAYERRLDATHLQAIEGNPLDAEDLALFEMFERENWPHERRIEHIEELAKRPALVPAAE